MKAAGAKVRARILLCMIAWQTCAAPIVSAYTRDYIVPAAGGCPVVQQQNIGSSASPLARQWSTSLPNINPPTIVTVAPAGSAAQLTEIGNTIAQAYGIWTGVSGTLVNASTFPNALGPLGQTTVQNACTPDSAGNSQTGVDGIDTICFNQSSSAFTTGVLSFTRMIIAGGPGQVFGTAPTSVFAGQIVDADIYFRNDGQASWYSRQLKALDEPSLWQISQEKKNAVIYRFLWLRTFHHPVAVRVAITPDGAATIFIKTSSGAGGYDPGTLIQNENRTLSRDEVAHLMTQIETANFWRLATCDPKARHGMDGAEWVLEEVDHGNYHVVERWSPTKGTYHDLCQFFVRGLARLRFPGSEVY
jgi:hypothetical protein